MDKKILIIDDESAIVQMTSHILQRRGYTTASCGSAKEAVEIIKTFKPDLIILDHLLPGKTGLEFCREMKSSPQACLIPILITTGQKLTLEAEILRRKLFKPDHILSKPFDIDELLKIVGEFLKGK